ncbi:MAG TPA: hypothetical protein VFT64_06535 [Rickettsiales bacterium]|nr:hypothetical protein [Rickettsiales bacterium]
MEHEFFLAAFEGCKISKAEWTHEAHVRMAWLYLKAYGDWTSALPIVRNGIKRLNQSHGNMNGYHETITIVYLQLVAERLEDSETVLSWPEFMRKYPELLDYNSPAFLRYYSRELIFSQQARQQFVAPDLTPLPFHAQSPA